MEALPGPSGMRRLMSTRVGGGVVVGKGRGWMVAVRHAPRMWLALRGGAVVGSPGRMWVWVALHRALLVGRRLVVIELVVLVIVETIALHTLRGVGAPVCMTGRARRAVVGRGKRRLRARRTEPTGARGGGSVLLARRGSAANGLTYHGRVSDVGSGCGGGLGKLTPAAAGRAGPRGGGDWTAAYWTTALHENWTRQIKQNQKINHTTRRETVGDDTYKSAVMRQREREIQEWETLQSSKMQTAIK